jgi:branched-chain amino acid aminotransferase
MVFFGSEGMGLRADNLKTHVIVAAWEWPSYMSPEARELGIKVQTSSFTRHHVNIAVTRAKANGQYINSMMALAEAQRGGYDEALLLDPQGYAAEGSGENLFVIKNGIIYTPMLTSCLNGITRNTVLNMAEHLGFELREKLITRDEIYIADEAFFTGTAAEVLPIRELDGRTIGEGRRGPITEKIQSLYFDLVRGKQALDAKWLTPVA